MPFEIINSELQEGYQYPLLSTIFAFSTSAKLRPFLKYHKKRHHVQRLSGERKISLYVLMSWFERSAPSEGMLVGEVKLLWTEMDDWFKSKRFSRHVVALGARAFLFPSLCSSPIRSLRY